MSEKTPEEKKIYNQRISDIKNKVTWGTATYQERNVLMIHNKKMKKRNGSKS